MPSCMRPSGPLLDGIRLESAKIGGSMRLFSIFPLPCRTHFAMYLAYCRYSDEQYKLILMQF